jgi:hypothetical protein
MTPGDEQGSYLAAHCSRSPFLTEGHFRIILATSLEPVAITLYRGAPRMSIIPVVTGY